MALNDFISINMPYGMKRNDKDEWLFFNREYSPLGWNKKSNESIRAAGVFSEFPLYTRFQKITESFLLEIAIDSSQGILRNEKGEIEVVFFYNDRTNPQLNSGNLELYFEKIKLLMKCKAL